MSIRSLRERLLQTVCFELGGVVVATPIYMIVTGNTAAEGAPLVVALAIVVMVWSPLHNSIFDVLEWRLLRRIASDRPHRWRIVHAVSHEVTSLVVTVPAILMLTDHTLLEAVLLDIGLTVIYIVYAYLFHVIYDRFRPVPQGAKK